MKKQIIWGVRLALGLAVLALLVRRMDFSQMSVRLDSAAWLGFAGTVSLLVATQALSALRWRMLLGDDAPPFLYLWRLYAIGAFFSLFLPTSVGGDAVRAVAAVQSMPRSGGAVVSVVLDRALGMLALAIYAVIGVLLLPDAIAPLRQAAHWKSAGPKVWLMLGGLVIVAAAGALLASRIPKLKRLIGEGVDYLRHLRHAPGRLAAAVLLGLVVQAGYIVAWMSLAFGLRLGIPATFFLVAVPVVSLAAMLPVTFAGIGVREGAWVLLLSRFGLASANAVAYSLLYFGAVVLLGAGGGLLFVIRGTAPAPSQVVSA
jgi:uncharacterized membrane protein YbhN (UPF0104 family)